MAPTPPPVPKLADRIDLVRDPNGPTQVLINGEPLGYLVSQAPGEAPGTELTADNIPMVRLTLLARSVHVSDQFAATMQVKVADD